MVGIPQSANADRVDAVIVDFHSGRDLVTCVEGLLDDGCGVTVVDNAPEGTSRSELGSLVDRVQLLEVGTNLGFGAGVNRGAAMSSAEFLLICNPDLVVHAEAVDLLVSALDVHEQWGIAAPMILDPSGEMYPSARRFPNMIIAAGHALLAPIWPSNGFTKRYQSAWSKDEQWGVDWVSGACFLIRRSVFETLGGFDEAFFMFAEDLDLCRRAHDLGIGVGFVDRATVTHIEGLSRKRQPYRMLLAHHRSAFRYQAKHSSGVKVLLLPFAAVVLLLRLGVTASEERFARRTS